MSDNKEKAVTIIEHLCKPMEPIQRVVGISLIKMPKQDNPVWFHCSMHEKRPTQLHAIFYCPYCGKKLSEEDAKCEK